VQHNNRKHENEKIVNMSAEEQENNNAIDLKAGPFSVLWKAVKGNTQVLVNVRNNHKLLGRVKAYDRHMNLLLEDVKEMWTENAKGGKGKTRGTAVNKDRYVSKMFLRGDSVIIIVSNPVALAEQQQQQAADAADAAAVAASGSGEIAESTSAASGQ